MWSAGRRKDREITGPPREHGLDLDERSRTDREGVRAITLRQLADQCCRDVADDEPAFVGLDRKDRREVRWKPPGEELGEDRLGVEWREHGFQEQVAGRGRRPEERRDAAEVERPWLVDERATGRRGGSPHPGRGPGAPARPRPARSKGRR